MMQKKKPQPASGKVLFTYDVIWIEDTDTEWSNRWDVYMKTAHAGVSENFWVFVLRHILVVLVSSAIISAMFVQNFQRILSRYHLLPKNDREEEEEIEDEVADGHCLTGWRVLHEDVFRPPSQPMLLAILCGTGAQLVFACLITACIGFIGWVNQAKRGSIPTGFILSYCFSGIANGYVAVRLYRSFFYGTFGANFCRRVATVAAVLVPGIAFSIFWLVSITAWCLGLKSTIGPPLMTHFSLLGMWMLIFYPLVLLGGRIGYKDATDFTEKASNIRRQIPPQPRFLEFPFTSIAGGVLPFIVLFTEIRCILASLWAEGFYNHFAFLLFSFLVAIIATVQVTIAIIYLQLNHGNHVWWWNAFKTAGGLSLWVFFYSVWWYHRDLGASGFFAFVFYFGYMALISLGIFCMVSDSTSIVE
jgi:transmembrane 9 superfamily protein 2/4